MDVNNNAMSNITKPMSGKICMVTGATSGISETTALGLAKQGADVIVVGRNSGKGVDTVNRTSYV